MTPFETLQALGETAFRREEILTIYLEKCDRKEAHLLAEDGLPFLAHIRATDPRLWLSHLFPVIQFWPKEERVRFERLLDQYGPEPSAQETEPAHFDAFNAETLRVEDVPETRWIVKGLLPEGLASLAGRPKQGKSWLALNLAISVAMGGKALMEYEIPQPGNVLFLALEDNKSRLKNRMGQLMRQVTPWPDKLEFAIFSPRMGAGFTETLRQWLESHPAPALVVVDMYTKIAERRKRKSNQSDYDDIYEELAPLQALTYEFHIALLLVMHLNKTVDAEDATARIMGSTAFSGATTTNLILRRLTAGQAADAILSPNGKDIEDDEDVALVFESGIWTSRGNADLYNQSQQRLQILETLYMAKGKETTPKDIAEAIDKKAGATRRLLQKLREDGLISKDAIGGTYHLTNAGADVLKARTEDSSRDRNLDTFEDNPEDWNTHFPPHWSDNIEPEDF